MDAAAVAAAAGNPQMMAMMNQMMMQMQMQQTVADARADPANQLGAAAASPDAVAMQAAAMQQMQQMQQMQMLGVQGLHGAGGGQAAESAWGSAAAMQHSGGGAAGGGKGGKPTNSTFACSVHGKVRGVRNLTDDFQGGMRCTTGFECQVGAGEGGAACSIHGKNRTISNLVDDGNGAMCCAPGFECNNSGTASGGQKKYRICTFFEQYGECRRGVACTFAHHESEIGTIADVAAAAIAGMGVIPGDWNCPNCGDHQFARNAECRKCGSPKPPRGAPDESLSATPEGAMGEPTMLCSAHGIERSVMVLTNDGAGGICCKPGSECQPKAITAFGGGAGGGWGGKGGGGKRAEARPGQKKWVMCTWFQKNDCHKGPACTFAHSEDEIGTVAQEAQGSAPAQTWAPQTWGAAAEAASLGGGKGKGMMPGDWNCPSCGDHQFARNTSCRKCGAPNPGGGADARASPY